MSAPTIVTVETFRAAGDQLVGCGHIVRKGEPVFDLRFGRDLTDAVISMCQQCLDGIGKLGNE